MTIRWRNKVVGGLVLFLVVVGCMGFVMSRFLKIVGDTDDDNTLFYVALGFIGLVFCGIVVMNLLKFVRNLRTTYEIAVGTEEGGGVRYAEYSASAPDAPARKVITLAPADIAGVGFEHQIAEQPLPIRVLVRDPAKEGLSLDVMALSATDRIRFAIWLRENTCKP